MEKTLKTYLKEKGKAKLSMLIIATVISVIAGIVLIFIYPNSPGNSSPWDVLCHAGFVQKIFLAVLFIGIIGIHRATYKGADINESSEFISVFSFFLFIIMCVIRTVRERSIDWFFGGALSSVGVFDLMFAVILTVFAINYVIYNFTKSA